MLEHDLQPRASHTPRRRPNRWIIVSLTLLATVVAIIGGLIWLVVAHTVPRSRVAALNVPVDGKMMGDPNAPVDVVEWGDFQCPFCQRFALGPGREFEQTLVATGKARFSWRHLAFLGQESVWAAQAAECANDQNRFWDYHDKLFAEQKGENRGAFVRDNLKRFAVELRLDRGAFNLCLDTDQTLERVQAETSLARREGVRSTPTIILNGQKMSTVPTFNQLRQAVEALAGQ